MATLPEPKVTKKMADEINDKMADTIKEVEAELSGIAPIGYEYERGSTSIILKEKVENKSYDLVMLQGQTEQGLLLQNSVIMNVVQNVPCPVYIMPPDAKYQPFKKIIYGNKLQRESHDNV